MMEKKFREWRGLKVKISTVDTYCSQLKINRLNDYPEIKEQIGITSIFEITTITQYKKLERLIYQLVRKIEESKTKNRHASSDTNLVNALKKYEKFLKETTS